MTITTPENPVQQLHDRFFKSALSHGFVAKDFFRQHLPGELLNCLNLNSIKFLNTEYADVLSEKRSDVVYGITYKNHSGQFYAHVEHQSTPDRRLIERVEQYQHAIVTRFQRQKQSNQYPFIFSLVFYNGKGVYPYPMTNCHLYQAPAHLVERYIKKPIRLIDCHTLQEQELSRHPWSYPFQRLMKNVRVLDIVPILESLLPTLEVLKEQGELDYLKNILDYAFYAGNIQNESRFIKLVQNLSETITEDFMTPAEYFTQKGVQQGIQEGIQEGMQQGVEQGSKQTQIEAIRNMLELKMDLATISKVLGLSSIEIRDLIRDK